MTPHWSSTSSRAPSSAPFVLWRARDAAPRKTIPPSPCASSFPTPAGGGTDALARFLASGLEKRLGQPFIIENRPGQGTATGGLFVVRSAPDGYTLLAATSSTLRVQSERLQKAAL